MVHADADGKQELMDVCCPPQVEKNRDNILPRIMASSEGHTSLFERELSKYDGLKGAGRLSPY